MTLPSQWAFTDGFPARPAVVGFWLQVACFILSVVSIVLLVRTRTQFPVNNRFRFMIIGGLSLCFQIFWWALAIPSISCGLFGIVSFVTTQVTALCYLARVSELLLRLNIAKGLVYGSGEGEVQSANWYLLHRRFASRWFQLKFLIGFAVFCLLLIVVCFVFDPRLQDNQWCPYPSSLHRVNSIMLIIWFAVFLFFASKLRGSSGDSLSLKTELRATVYTLLVCITPFLVVTLVMEPSWEYNAILRSPIYVGIFVIGFLYPVYLSSKHKKMLQADRRMFVMSSEMHVQLLSKLLLSSDFPIFLEFLKGEFSAENGMFLRAYHLVRENPNHTPEDFSRIAAQFVFPNSPGEINIPYGMRAPIMKLLNANGSSHSRKSQNEPKPGTDVLVQRLLVAFDAARGEVFDAVARDSLPRFLATEEGAKTRASLMGTLAPQPRGSLSVMSRSLRNFARQTSGTDTTHSGVSTSPNRANHTSSVSYVMTHQIGSDDGIIPSPRSQISFDKETNSPSLNGQFRFPPPDVAT